MCPFPLRLMVLMKEMGNGMKDEMNSIFLSSLSVSVSVSTDSIRLWAVRYRRLLFVQGGEINLRRSGLSLFGLPSRSGSAVLLVYMQ